MPLPNDIKPFLILIVDDEPRNIQMLGSILKSNGYRTEFATNGEKALDWLKHKEFDLILLDIMMPGMDGYEVCKKIKANKYISHIPIIFLSAKTESEDIVNAFSAGGTDYVTKPFNTPELLARIKTHVEIKTLRGLIPICVNCKKLKNKEGVWQQIEAYFHAHTDALLSHGLCHECAEKLYGSEQWYKDRKGE